MSGHLQKQDNLFCQRSGDSSKGELCRRKRSLGSGTGGKESQFRRSRRRMPRSGRKPIRQSWSGAAAGTGRRIFVFSALRCTCATRKLRTESKINFRKNDSRAEGDCPFAADI